MSSEINGPCCRYHIEQERGVTQVSVTSLFAHVCVKIPSDLNRVARQVEALETVAQQGIIISFTKIHDEWITFAIPQHQADTCSKVLKEAGFDINVVSNLSLVTTTAGNMRELWGVMSQIADTLIANGIYTVEVGDSYADVRCLIPEQQAERAAELLRNHFGIEEAA